MYMNFQKLLSLLTRKYYNLIKSFNFNLTNDLYYHIL